MITNSPKWPILIAAGLVTVVTLLLLRGPVARFFFQRGLQAKVEWRLEDAVRHFERALFLKSDLDEARFEKGICHQLRGDFLNSQRDFDRLSQESIRNPVVQAQLLNAIGVNRFNSNEPDAAREAHRQSLKLAQKVGDLRLEAHALIDLGRVLYHSKGEAELALEYLERALQIGRETSEELIQADALRNIGVVYWWLKGELDRPLREYYQPALEIYRRQNDLRGAAITLTNIGFVHNGRGDYLQFLEYQNEAIEIKSRIGDLAGLSDSYSALGALYVELGNYRRASEYFARGLELSRQIGYRLTQNDLEASLAVTYMSFGEFDKAIALLKELPDRARHTPLLAKYYTEGLARCYLLKGEPGLALQVTERIAEEGLRDPHFEISAWSRLGEIYTELGEWQKASDSLAKSEALLPTVAGTWWGGRVEYHVARAGLAERQRLRSQALTHLLEAAEIESHILSSDQNLFLRGQNRRIYDRLFTLLLEPTENQAPKATRGYRADDLTTYRVVERLRYRAFRNFVGHLSQRKAKSPSVGKKEAEEAARIDRLSARLRKRETTGLREQLRQAYSHYEDLVLRSEMAEPEYRMMLQARPAELEAVQKTLDSQTALVEYLFGGDKVFALVITRTSLRSTTLPVTKANLSAKVKLLRSMIFDGNTSTASSDSDWRPVATDLRRVLIEPLEQQGALAGVNRLGLIPYGFLHDLPFAALTRAEDGGLKFLIEDYKIFYTPSATYLTIAPLLNDSKDRGSSYAGEMLSFGRDETDEPDLLPLRYAASEATFAARTFEGQARINGQATETELKKIASGYRYIHFAAHAVSEPEMPLLARLKLQPTSEDDGNLSIREILRLGLKAELVTLGACRSGQSFSTSGSESKELDRVGLIEAFLHAGSRNVLASLLPINDGPTTEFMKLFYQHLRLSGKADALIATQRAMLRGELAYIENGQPRRLNHPRYWAPFILVGDYR